MIDSLFRKTQCYGLILGPRAATSIWLFFQRSKGIHVPKIFCLVTPTYLPLRIPNLYPPDSIRVVEDLEVFGHSFTIDLSLKPNHPKPFAHIMEEINNILGFKPNA